MAAGRALPALAAVLALSGCGWAPLYADPETGPAAGELAAIRVEPISERIGQRLEMALRNALDPSGEPVKQRYALYTVLKVSLSDLGIQTQGTAVLGRVDVFADYRLTDIKSGSTLLSSEVHSQNSFSLDPNEYSTVVAEDDAGVRSVVEITREMVARLTLFMERRVAGKPAKPI
ncbi:MAG TPA: LPS assembly lipoprotein LptE [Stellaceae bacterium]|jgi:LPS-assembly lipoprotein|nr:LPS assembly lipoprotein LptE [Stellaceae bacterium]